MTDAEKEALAEKEKEAAKAAAAQGEGEGAADDGGDDFDAEKAKLEIKRLRDENAKHRQKNKGLEERVNALDGTIKKFKTELGLEESEDPAERLKSVQQQKEALEAEVAVARIIYDNDIPKDSEKYFRFLLSEKFSSLKEGEELTEEDLAAVVKEARAKGAKASGATGVDPVGKPAPDGGSSGLSPESFAKMSVMEKSQLYSKNPDLYNKLFTTASEKKLI